MRIAVIDTGAGNLASVLRAFRRAAGEAGLAAAYDVVVVGLGVTGAGVALDAAARGLRVGLRRTPRWTGPMRREASTSTTTRSGTPFGSQRRSASTCSTESTTTETWVRACSSAASRSSASRSVVG